MSLAVQVSRCSGRKPPFLRLLGQAFGRSLRHPIGHAITVAVVAGAVLSSTPAAADDPEARAIMERVDARDDGDDQTSQMQMILIDKRENQRIRELHSFVKDVGPDSYSMLFFSSPADVKDTGFLTYDYDEPDRDDDQWLYLPALKKTKRIAGSDKSGSFMGSDFSYADMTDRPLSKYDYTLLQEGEVDGHPVWVIESVPRSPEEVDETGYEKSVLFVRKDNDVVIRSKIWLKKGGRNKYMDVETLEKIDGIWVPTVITMTTKKGSKTLHRTVLRIHDVRFGQDLDIDSFSVRGLEAGP